MSHIETTEGPIIGLDREILTLWGGNDNLSFFSSVNQGKTDYDVLCTALLSDHELALTGVILQGRVGPVICLGSQSSTYIVTVAPGLYMFVQVEFADEDWDISEVSLKDFDEAQIKVGEIGRFASNEEPIVFFDSSLTGSEISSEYIQMRFETGIYSLISAYNSDGRRGLCIFLRVKLF